MDSFKLLGISKLLKEIFQKLKIFKILILLDVKAVVAKTVDKFLVLKIEPKIKK